MLKPTKAQREAIQYLPVEAVLCSDGVLLERLTADHKVTRLLGVRYTTFDGLVSRGLAKKVDIVRGRRWRYEAITQERKDDGNQGR